MLTEITDVVMATYELRSEDGRTVSFDLDDERRLVNATIDRLAAGEEVRFEGSDLPEHLDAGDLPDAVAAFTAGTGRRVCLYTDHEVCFCDDDGNMTCVGMT